MGNNVETDLVGNVIGTTAFQEVNPQVLEKADAYSKKGTFMMHELTEAYEGAVISANKKTSSPNSSEAGTVYRKAHDKATYQPPVGVRCYESEGNVTSKLQEAKRVEWFVVSPNNSKNEKTIQTLP